MRRKTFWSVTAVLCIAASTVSVSATRASETWAQRLGYPPGKRVVILYAAQMGILYETGAASRELLEQGICRSAGVLATGPWFEEVAAWHREHPGLDVGLSLTVTSEWKNYRWGPVAARSEVPSLVDGDGYLAASVLQFSLDASADEVEKEINAQIQKARAAGLRPTHLAPHLGALLARPDLMAIYLNAARKHWIPAVMVELTPEHIARFRAAGVPLEEGMVDLITSYPLPKVDDLRFMPDGDSRDAKQTAFMELIRNLEPGITEIVAQPAADSAALRAVAKDWQQRVWDAQVLCDPEVREFLQSEDLVFTSWREMMHRFEGRLPADLELPAAKNSAPASSTPEP